MYHVYQTNGFILRSAPHGEANKLLFIFTKELGLISAQAQSARKVTSKLRYGLRDASFSRFALVRGRAVWRLTDAEEIFSFSVRNFPEKTKIFSGILRLVTRFVHGEEENTALFNELESLGTYLRVTEFMGEDLRMFETLAVFRVLATLGYTGEDKSLFVFIKKEFSPVLLDEFIPYSRLALREINRALEESHL